MKYIANCSFGKDSLAMVLYLLENHLPLDEVVFYDTGMEFQAIYNVRDNLIPALKSAGVKYAELKPKNPFLYDMLERPKIKRNGQHAVGDGWCGGACRWGTIKKVNALNKYCGTNHVYIGLAFDEQNRIKNLDVNKSSPISDAKMTEADCLKYCRDRGYSWQENGIDLYDVLDRVSCWCCCNKNKKELKNIYLYLPEYWKKLKDLQSKIDRPMKKFSNRKYGDYGNLFDLERVFKEETEN